MQPSENASMSARVRDGVRAWSAAVREIWLDICIALAVMVAGTAVGWMLVDQDGGVLIAKTYSHLRSEHSDRMALKLA